MKIAYLANVRFPGNRAHAVQIAHMCQAFVATGMEVDLYVNKREVSEKAAVDEFFGFTSNFSVTNLPPKIFLPRIKWTFYVSELLFSLAFLIKVRKSIYDVVYSRHEWVLYFLLYFVPVKQLIWESHEAKYNFPARQLLAKGVRCVCISEGIYSAYQAQGIPADQLVVAHDAVDASFFLPQPSTESVRERLGLPFDKKIVLYIGGFDAWKGVETFFAASELLSEVQFVAIGGRPEEVTRFQQKYPKVQFLGPLPYRNLPANQQAGDILIIPNVADNNLSEKYTSPLKLFAHVTSGVPLIISDVHSLCQVTGRELVSTFVPGDAASLAQTISNVLSEYSVWQQKAKKMQEIAKVYTWHNRAQKIKSFLFPIKS